MKILQYTLGLPPYRRGGLPRYSTDLSLELSKDNEVTLLYPGEMPIFDSNKLNFKIEKSKYPFKVVEMINPLPVSLGLGINKADPYMKPRDKKNIIIFLKKVSPEVIHIHTLMGLPIEFLEVAKSLKIRIVYTTHDFYGLCPKTLKENPLKLLRNRQCTYDCMLCKNGPSLHKIKIMQSHQYMWLKNTSLISSLRKQKKDQILSSSNYGKVSDEESKSRYDLRMYYLRMFSLIDYFHYNSTVSKLYIQNFLPNACGKVINITHDGLKDNRKHGFNFKGNKIKFGYIGPYDDKKGFFELCKVLTEIRKYHNNFEVHFYGDVITKPIFSKDWIINHGVLPSDQMYRAYKNIDVLIVPSLWHETFGFSVLEALSYGDICLVSENVGAKDLINQECIFKSERDLSNILQKICIAPEHMMKTEFLKIRQKELPLSFKDHVKKIYKKIYCVK